MIRPNLHHWITAIADNKATIAAMQAKRSVPISSAGDCKKKPGTCRALEVQ